MSNSTPKEKDKETVINHSFNKLNFLYNSYFHKQKCFTQMKTKKN